ncbi:hypothetical protein [Paenibacillus sp. S02]|uniref:hypothetical protein n=1 Tax=Paenibacillus sp. S02 TaxID=2823904 RepID=UPI001C645C41|nr:hypothetical protein [Paenibacillus sp. S02]QYK67525.1 hypothetical protein KAI36_02675 [Paenibacillus sp. S02]
MKSTLGKAMLLGMGLAATGKEQIKLVFEEFIQKGEMWFITSNETSYSTKGDCL